MAQAILELEATIRAWSTDAELDDGAEQTGAVLRTLISRLARVTTTGLTDPAQINGYRSAQRPPLGEIAVQCDTAGRVSRSGGPGSPRPW